MATKAQIDRLALRIEQTIAALEPRPPRKVVQIIHDPMDDDTEEAALARHLAAHPDDRDFTDLIIARITHPTSGIPMATRSQIDRLAQRIEALGRTNDKTRPQLGINGPPPETRDQWLARTQNKRDRSASDH